MYFYLRKIFNMEFLFCVIDVSCLFNFDDIFNFNKYFQYNQYTSNNIIENHKEEDISLNNNLFDSYNRCFLCKKYITYTFYMYNDNMFCSDMCRFNKFNNDNKNQ
jgi:hypothetical protein